MNEKAKSQSTFLKVLQAMFSFASSIAKDIKAGDLIGAATRFGIIALGFFFSLFIISIIASSWNKEAIHFCWILMLVMAVIAILLLYFLFHRPPDDHNLAGGQNVRAISINPAPIQ